MRRAVRSRGPVLLALAAVGVLVGVLANAFFAGGQAPPPAQEAAVLTEPPVGDVLAETSASAQTQASPPEEEPDFALTYTEASREPVRPRLFAKSYLAIDAETGEVLVARHDQRVLPIASLTKVMTALIVIEDGQLDRKIKVPKVATLVEPNKEGLVAGRWYPRRLLLYSALMVSANDSAEALAFAAGDGSLSAFHRRMNALADELGMEHTAYASASGLEDEGNVSTAADQAILARFALENPTFARIVGTARRVVEWPPPTHSKEWINHNRMLTAYPGTYGVKTGYTSKAGGCLVVAVRRDGRDVIAVVLGSRNIWRDMPLLVDAALARAGS
jgi:D-alanyl-D-alanine carboxypeptidase (penicillin-binding protein 5/6)